jgi:hypothetical protein
MWVLLVAMVVLIALTIFNVQTDRFEDPIEAKYKLFAASYNEFLVAWEKAVTTSWSSKIEQAPVGEGPTSAKPPQPTKTELNQEITRLVMETGKSFPPLTDPMPPSVASASGIPADPTPYRNALEWMNQHMRQSQEDLKAAMSGTSSFADYAAFSNPLDEPFADMCQQMAQCQQQQQAQQQQQMGTKFDRWNGDAGLQAALQENKRLTAQAKNTQNQAQSGQLLNQLDFPSEPSVKYELPKGANALRDMKDEDPKLFDYLKSNFRVLFDFKQWTEQINRNLK